MTQAIHASMRDTLTDRIGELVITVEADGLPSEVCERAVRLALSIPGRLNGGRCQLLHSRVADQPEEAKQ